MTPETSLNSDSTPDDFGKAENAESAEKISIGSSNLTWLLDKAEVVLQETEKPDFRRLKKLHKQLAAVLDDSDLEEEHRKKIENRFQKLSAKANSIQTEIDKLQTECMEFLKQLEQSVEATQTKQSQSLYEKCKFRINRLSDLGETPSKVDKLNKELSRIKPALNQLKSWRSYGMERAREELIAEVEGLIDTNLKPQALRERIHGARTSWKKWNQSGDYPNRALRQRFDAACTKAYEPCKAYMIEQKAKREVNLEKRNQICEELEEIFNSTNWNRPDWMAVGAAIRAARKNWKLAAPLSKRDWQKTNERFDQVLSQYEPYLDRERERCHQRRYQLIEQVEALASKPLREAIEQTKKIQAEWKNVTVRGSKQKENQLWEQFRSACDKQFARRTAQQEAFKQQRQESMQTKKALLEDLKALNQQSIEEIEEFQAKASALRRQWEALPQSKKGSGTSIDSALEAQFKGCTERITKLRHRNHEALISALEVKSQLCVQLENAVGTANAPEMLDSICKIWRTNGTDCGDCQKIIDQRFSSVCEAIKKGDSKLPSTTENLSEKQDICLELEVLAEIDSPPEFARDRMAYQVNRLNAKMTDASQQIADPQQRCRDLMRKYLLIGAVPPESSASIENRFARIRDETKQGFNS